MEDINAEIEKTLVGLNKLCHILSTGGGYICECTQFVDYETSELKATGARIVFIPKESMFPLLQPFAIEIGVPGKPEKYHKLAIKKAFTSLKGDRYNNMCPGGLPLSNGFGALGLSGFKERDNHIVLAAAMRESGLLTYSDVRDPQLQEAISWESAMDLAWSARFKYHKDEISDWLRVCSSLLMTY